MMLHSKYTNDETCYYLQIFALLMLIDYIPHFHEISQFFVQCQEERSRVGTSSSGCSLDSFDQVFMFGRLSRLR